VSASRKTAAERARAKADLEARNATWADRQLVGAPELTPAQRQRLTAILRTARHRAESRGGDAA
jgi:hypothetical protein